MSATQGIPLRPARQRGPGVVAALHEPALAPKETKRRVLGVSFDANRETLLDPNSDSDTNSDSYPDPDTEPYSDSPYSDSCSDPDTYPESAAEDTHPEPELKPALEPDAGLDSDA